MATPLVKSESELQWEVRQVCRVLQVFHYHTHDSRFSEPGFPDSVIIGVNGMLFRELKREDGKLTADQELWRNIIRAAGGDWDLWRPSDLASGRIWREVEAVSMRGSKRVA